MANPAIRTGTPFIRARIGDGDVFQSGDGYLQACEVQLSEGEGLSNCRFTIFDPSSKYANKYFETIFNNDGLDPIFLPKKESSSGGRNGSVPPSSSSYTSSDQLSPNVKAFLDGLAFHESNGAYNVSVGGVTFDDYSDHPRLFDEGLNSDAAGRYQFISTTWDPIAQSLGLTDFSPESQDLGAVELIRQEEALGAVEEGDFTTAANLLLNQWASLPGASQALWDSMEEFVSYVEERVAYYEGNAGEVASNTAAKTVQESRQPVTQPAQTTVSAKVGSQITVEIGFDGEPIAAYSFLHTSLEYDLFAPLTLTFGGMAAAWVLTQRKRNTAYSNLTLKQIAQRIAEKYGLNLEMEEDGPDYEYFPQRGVSDYEALLIECRRIGFRVQSIGNVLKIGAREVNDSNFTLVYGENLGTTFTVTHQAATDSSGGARSSDSNSRATTGERKFVVDPDSGQVVQTALESAIGAGIRAAETATTGGHITLLAPVQRRDSSEDDKARKESEQRIKGIIANFSAVTLPEMLTLDPDSAIRTENISPFLDRVWVVESIKHTYSDGSLVTSGTLYTPLKNKNYKPEATNPITPVANPSGAQFINPLPGGLVTDHFGWSEWRGRRHAGTDISAGGGATVIASAAGVVTSVSFDDGGYGNYIVIDHGGGYETLYAHLESTSVSNGDQVKQGQAIGIEGSTGGSTGPHLHFEIYINGVAQDPEAFVTF